ncbi:MAG: Methionyl-tRNA formyltransferase [Ktedonobacterales bacterium]|jgi:methionyl-tRNA formyltransferase|nr:MAG: Methionyl-tRNA formyltransferase [Ktedonobacterales bacterium]
MSAEPALRPQLSVVFFGMSGVLSALPLESLLRAGIDVRAVVMAALSGDVRPETPPTRELPPPASASRKARALLPVERGIRQIAADTGVPVFEVARLRARETLATLSGFAPDAICVSCFPRRLPPDVLRLPRLGCLNVHPSLLPDNRGPDPLFWVFQRGDAQTGVTIHLMDEGFDSGPVLAQETIIMRDGVSEARLERMCAEVAGPLLIASLKGLAAGTLAPRPQDESRATSYSLPSAEDYRITPDRPARWAYNFASGVLARGQPIVIATPEREFRLVAPLDFDAEATLDAPWRLDGAALALRCAPGVFRARVSSV